MQISLGGESSHFRGKTQHKPIRTSAHKKRRPQRNVLFASDSTAQKESKPRREMWQADAVLYPHRRRSLFWAKRPIFLGAAEVDRLPLFIAVARREPVRGSLPDKFPNRPYVEIFH